MTDDQPDVVEREIYIRARPETVFAYFTDPEKLMRWKGIHANIHPAPGGIFRVDLNGHDIVRGVYAEVVPYSRVIFTWGWEGEASQVPPGSSTVEVTLIPDEQGTYVRLRHLNLSPDQQEAHRMGWDHYLPRLATVAEGRDPGPDPWAFAPMGTA